MTFFLICFFCRAEALQSIIQLLGEKELYEVNRDQYRLHNVDWTQEKAKKVLEAWQRKFTQEVNRILNDSVHDEVVAFSSTSLMDILKEFSQVSVVRVALGYVLMVSGIAHNLIIIGDKDMLWV